MKRYIKIFLYLLKFSLQLVMEYRFDFFSATIQSFGWVFISVVSFSVLFQNTPEILGWDKNEVLTLYGVYMCINALWSMFFSFNLTKIPDYIQYGEMDSILLLPISAQFLISIRNIMIFTMPYFIVSICVLIYYSSRVTKEISFIDYFFFTILLLNGLMMIYSIMLMMITLSFWVVRLKAFREFYETIVEGARFPVEFFKNPLQFIFVFIIPLAMIFTFPAQFLVKTLSPQFIVFSLCVGGLLFFISHKFFYFGIKHYNSASS